MEYLTDILNQITSLKGVALIAVCLLALGYVLKAIPQIPNALIPASVITGGMILTPILGEPGAVSPDIKHPLVGLVLQGFLIGVAAWILHEKVIKHFEGWLKGKLPGGGAPVLLACAVPLLFTGCATDGFAKVVRELKDDPATVKLNVQSPWGVNIQFERSVPVESFTLPAEPTAKGQ